MVCPYCQVEYTADQPCFCHPTFDAARDERDAALLSPLVIEDEAVCWNTSRGNRID